MAIIGGTKCIVAHPTKIYQSMSNALPQNDPVGNATQYLVREKLDL